jgi:hypothetical protein
VRKELLNTFQQNTNKISEDQETDEDDMTEHERMTNQDARKFTAGLHSGRQ